MTPNVIDPQDLDYVLVRTEKLWRNFQGQRIFLTGGTGFFGCWLLETFLWINLRLDLGMRLVVLTRDPEAFTQKARHLAESPAIELWPGDVRDFVFPPGEFTQVIHAAAEASAQLNAHDPLKMIDCIVDGTRRVLEFARRSGPQRLLLVSSGGVYSQSPDGGRISEDCLLAVDTRQPQSAYGEAKRLAEQMAACYQAQHGLSVVVARCFAFVGPYLPLDRHYAIGNFIGDALAGRAILIKGDGRARRSYLYAADLALHLWTLLLDVRASGTFNVGAEEDYSIQEIAQTVASRFQSVPEVKILGNVATPSVGTSWYVPNTARLREQLGLVPGFNLPTAIDRTLEFHRRHE